MPEEVGSDGAVKRTETMVYASRAESKANDLQGIQEMAQVTGGEVMLEDGGVATDNYSATDWGGAISWGGLLILLFILKVVEESM